MAKKKFTPGEKPIQTKYNEIKYRCSDPKRMVGRYTAEAVKRTYTEDFLDEADGQVHSIERHETIIHKGEEITNEMVPQILFYMQEGSIKDILISNQNRQCEPYERPWPVPFIVSIKVGRQPKKVIVQATTMKMALAMVSDHCELKDRGGDYEITSAKMANEFIIIEDTLRKLEREELSRNQDPMDRDLIQEAKDRKEQEKEEQEEQDPANRYYQIDARVSIFIDENDRSTDIPYSFLVRVPDADLAKVLIEKWIRKNLREKGKDGDNAKIQLTLDEAVIFNCTRVIPRAFTDEYIKHQESQRIADKLLYASEGETKEIIERYIHARKTEEEQK